MAYARSPLGLAGSTRKRKRVCVSCGESNDNPRFRWCVVCRIAGALKHKLWRHDHIKRSLCTECVEGSHYSFKTKHRFRKCGGHLKYHREWHAASYARRREAGQCVRCGKDSDGATYCKTHAAYIAKARRESWRARVATRRAA